LRQLQGRVPTGEAGELMIKGGIVMQGYYGNEQATRETIEGFRFLDEFLVEAAGIELWR